MHAGTHGHNHPRTRPRTHNHTHTTHTHARAHATRTHKGTHTRTHLTHTHMGAGVRVCACVCLPRVCVCERMCMLREWLNRHATHTHARTRTRRVCASEASRRRTRPQRVRRAGSPRRCPGVKNRPAIANSHKHTHTRTPHHTHTRTPPHTHAHTHAHERVRSLLGRCVAGWQAGSRCAASASESGHGACGEQSSTSAAMLTQRGCKAGAILCTLLD